MTEEINNATSPPVARINYLYRGGVGDFADYTDAAAFVRDVKEQNEYGVPMELVFYADAKGETIPRDFIQKMDPPPQGVTIMYTNVPVYYQNYEYAVAHGEEAQYRGSMAVTQACQRAIDKAIKDHYDDNRLSSDAVEAVIDRFGFERTMCVLGNTIRELAWDARFNNANQQWAAGIQIPDNPGMPFAALTSHTGLIDLFTNSVRRRYLRTQPLTEPDICTEAERILRGFREADKPNSPSGTHYMVKISDDFMARVRGQQTSRLSRYMPFRSFCLTTVKDRRGLYAMIRKDEDRSKPLRTVKPPARKKSSRDQER